MQGRTLVPLKGDDPLGEIIPYVERIAQPGMNVLFLLRVPGPWLPRQWQDSLLAALARLQVLFEKLLLVGAAIGVRNRKEKHSLELQRRLAKRKVFSGA